MVLAFIITTSILGYAFIGGLFGSLFYKTSSKRCKGCRNERHCFNDHGSSAAFAGMFWPLILPAYGGGMVANHLVTGEERAKVKAAQKDRDHERRMTELRAEQRLARDQKERTLADIRFLVENGIHAEVPGLYEVD